MSAADPFRQPSLPTASPETVREKVRVVVDFLPPGHAGPAARPLAFLWRGKKYVVEKVNLAYKRQHGDGYHWCFAVSDAVNSYVLRYDPETLRWTLEEVYMW